MSGSRGEANFVWKCSLCKRESSISNSIVILPLHKLMGSI